MFKEAEELPHAISHFNQIMEIIGGKKPLLILDYDGTLSPIVSDPKKAVLSKEMKDALIQLAEIIPVAVISGRDRADVEQKVALDQLPYAKPWFATYQTVAVRKADVPKVIERIDPNAFVIMSSIKYTKGGMIKKRPLKH